MPCRFQDPYPRRSLNYLTNAMASISFLVIMTVNVQALIVVLIVPQIDHQVTMVVLST